MCSHWIIQSHQNTAGPDGFDLINTLIAYDQSCKACISSRITTVIQVEKIQETTAVIMSYSRLHLIQRMLRHAWLNL